MGIKVAFLEEETDVVDAPSPVLLVPRSAVLGSGDRGRHVLVVRADDAEDGSVLLERRPVLVGTAQDSRLRIIDGLQPGERIVSDPPPGVDGGFRVLLAD